MSGSALPPPPARGPGHRTAAALVALLLLGFLSPILARGWVVFGHDNTLEVGLPPGDEARVQNRDFNDQSSVYVPEIHQHLNGDASGWISTWNPHVELGRPTAQLAGFGKAFPPTLVLSWLTRDALRLYSAQVVLALGLCALFAWLLCRALGLGPVPCLVAALGLSLGVFPTYWMTFALFLWGIAWTLALLWLVARELERPSLARLAGIAFALYALLLSGYPQQIVWHAYLLVGFALWRLARVPGGRARALALARLGAAVLVGLAAVLPVYLDVAQNARLSARLGADTAFFLKILPPLGGWRNVAGFLLQRFDAFWFGNPIRPEYPVRFNGVSLGPVLSTLALVTLTSPALARRVWPLQAFCAGTLVMTVWPAAYAFGVRHLGLSLSRTVPLSAALIPGVLLAARGAQHLLHERPQRAALALLGLAAGGVVGAAAWELRGLLDARFVAVGALAALATLSLAWLRRPWLAALVVAALTLWQAPRLALWRPIADVRRTSPLVDYIGSQTEGGWRFALVAGGFGTMLPSNQEAFLGLRSVHSYNSLSPESYQDWTRRISPEGAQTYGRLFTNLSSDALLDGPELGFTGISLFLSGKPMTLTGLRAAGNYAGALVYALRRKPPLEAQAFAYVLDGDGARIEGELRDAGLLAVERTRDQDDRLAFRVTPAERETLLFVSQKHHPQWRARSDGRELACLPVNRFYLGVRVPPGTSTVELAFLPAVRWSWVPELGFALAAAALLARAALQRSRRRRKK